MSQKVWITEGNTLQGRVIKPCPFCGLIEWLQLVDDGVYLPKIECTNRGASMGGESANEAIDDWNQRPGEGPEQP